MRFDQELDARGLLCPLPILKTKVAMDKLQNGQVLKVIATDAGSVRDIQAFARQTRNPLLHSLSEGNEHIFYLRKEGMNAWRKVGSKMGIALRKMALIATKGTLDMAYPPFVLASTAAALGYEVQVFFSFYGLELLRKDLGHIKISPLANPAMPMPVAMPTMVKALPGMERMATQMMKAKIKKKGIASLDELRALCLEAGVKFIACEMTLDLFDMDHSDLIKGIEFGGAASFIDFAGNANISLFV